MLGYLASVGILMAVVSAWAYVETHLPARLESFSCHHPYDCEGCAQVDACELPVTPEESTEIGTRSL